MERIYNFSKIWCKTVVIEYFWVKTVIIETLSLSLSPMEEPEEASSSNTKQSDLYAAQPIKVQVSRLLCTLL